MSVNWDEFTPVNQPSEGSVNWDDFEPVQPKKERSKRSAADFAKDAGVVALKGAVGLPASIVGLADIPTGGRVGKFLEDNLGYRPGDAQRILADEFSDAQKEANQEVEQADGFVDTARAAIENPSTIATSVGESIPQMLGGAAAARGILKVAPKVAPWVAGALGEGAMGAGSSASSIREQSADGLLTPKQAGAALASGAGTAALGAAGGKLAQRAGLADVDTMLAAGVTPKSPTGFVKAVVGSGISEGVFEELPQSVQEQMWQNYATDKPLTDGVDKAAAMGLLSGAAMGAAGGGYSAAASNLGAQNVKDTSQGAGAGQAPAQAPATQAPPVAGPAGVGQPPSGVPAAGAAAAPVQAPGVATGDTDAAAKALREPLNLTALDRANELDAEVQRIGARMAELTPENGYGQMFDAERAELQQLAAAASAERDQIASTWPTRISGQPTAFSTEAGVKLDAEYALVDADSLVTSHDENLRQNPAFPAELQPRDRSRQASEMQVSGIVQKLDPARLGLSADAATGAPIIGADGLVESGNARTIALKRVYQANGAKADDYKAWLKQSAPQFGLAPEAVDGMNKPVLVRVRSTPVNRAEFARQANQSTVQRMSPSEQATSDAKRLTSLEGLNATEEGDFSTSYDFIRQFMGGLPITEQADMIESDGRLSTAGYRRMQNAVLAKAYGDSPTLRRMTESMDNNLINISRALTRAAPTIAAARDRMQAGVLTDADIAPDLLAAVEGLSAVKEKGWTVEQELGQTDLTGPKYSPEAAELLQFLADNIRSPRRIAEFLQRYHEALEAAGDPNQGSLLDDTAPPTRADLIKNARGTTDGQPDEQGSGRSAGQDRQEPQDAQGDQGRAQGDEGGQADADTGQPGADERQAGEVAREPAPAPEPEPAKKPAPRTADRDFWAYAKEQGHAPKDVPVGSELHTRLKAEFQALKEGKARLKAITGKKLSDEWTAFSKAAGTMGVPRADMPQIKAEHRGALTQFLAAREVTHESDADVSALDLKPTQAEFSPTKVKQAQEFEGGDRSILVSADGFVLDGHHQWLAKLAQGLPIRAIRFNAPMADLLPLAREFPSAGVDQASKTDPVRLERDFRTYPERVMEGVIEQGGEKALFKAAKVKGADSFGNLPMDDRAAAYVAYVQSGGAAVEGLPADYNAWVQAQERDSENRRMQSERVIRQVNGKPFKTEDGARQAQERFDAKTTHKVTPVDGGFELRLLPPAAQDEAKRIAAGRETYMEAQTAVLAEMGIGEKDGEIDATDAQWDEIERRVNARLRDGPALTAPTRSDIEAQQDRTAQADRLDQRAQVQRESEAGAGLFELAREDGRQDTTGGLFDAPVSAKTDPTAEAKKKAEPSKPAKEVARLTDAGEELIRNRRGKLKGLAWSDVSDMNDTLKVAQVVKANVWPRPDYAKMVEDGAPAWKAAAFKAVYDKLSAAPVTRAAPTDADLRGYIETMHSIRDLLNAEFDRVAAMPDGAELWKSLKAENVFGKVFPIPTDARPAFGRPSPFDRVSEQGKANNKRALLIGGNSAVQALQFDYRVLSKVKDLLAEGFPAKQEAWQKSWEVRATETRDSDVPEAERTGEPQQRFYVYEKGSRWRLAKGAQDGGYATQEQAEAFARSLTARKKEVQPPSRGLDIDKASRTGPDWRQGKDVTAQDIMDRFGFRGVNLGEYVKAKQDVAQIHLNHVYDAFSDLADLMGVPPKAMSLNGTLGVAIGAQGSGKALAHFAPGVNEINITRDSGAGALAHEFGHAMDHYFATQHGRATSMAKRPYLSAVVLGLRENGGVRPEVIEAMKEVMKTINYRPMTEAEARKYMEEQRTRNEKYLDRWVKEFSGNRGADVQALQAVASKIKRGDIGEPNGNDVETNIAEFIRAAGLKPGNSTVANAVMVSYRLRDLSDEAAFLKSHIPQVDTNYTKVSDAMDARKSGTEGYWGTPWEKFARAFETFAMDSLRDRQRESLYLSGLVDSKGWREWSESTGKQMPFPEGEERLAMQQAFQKLADTIQTREDDDGNVAMFSVAERDGNTDRLDFSALQDLAKRLKARMPNMPQVNVLPDPSKAPKALREYIIRQDAWFDVEGAMHDGALYLFASGLTDAARAEHVLLEHEAGHYGLRAVLGGSLKTAMRLVHTQNARVRKAVTELQKRGRLSDVVATEEVIVDIPTAELARLKGWRQVVAKARDWLADRGYTELAQRLTNWLDGTLTQQQRADLFVAELVRAARDHVAGKIPARAAVGPGTRLSGTLAEDIERQEQWLQTEARARGFKDIEDLLERDYPVFEKLAETWRKKNPAESLLSRGKDQTETPEFKRWFGDSKVVTPEGKPLVVYHGGGAEFDRIRKTGRFGEAIFVTDDKPSGYREVTYPLFLRGEVLENGMILDLLETKKGRKAFSDAVGKRVSGEKRSALIEALTDGSQYPTNEGVWETIGAIDEADAQVEMQKIRISLAKSMGYSAVRVPDEFGGSALAVVDPTSIKSATGNRGTFDPNDPDIRMSRPAPSAGATPKPTADRAEAIIQKPAGGFAPMDRLAQMATRATGVERLTGAIYNRAGALLNRLTPEKVKAGIVSDYGVPEAVIDQRIMLQGRQRVQLRKVGNLVEKLSTLTREESRVAYEWMNMDGQDPKAYLSMMQGLPEESVQVLQEVQKMIDDLSKEAVRMGQLPKEAFERNRFAYLRRSYTKHILEQTAGEKAKRSRVISILGDQYKGRGLVQAEPMARMQSVAADWWGRKLASGKADTALKGQKFIRLEKRATPGGGSPALPGMAPAGPGKVQRVAYWPADQVVTGEYADWMRADTWEVRDVEGGNVVLWRDFTKDEREQMGEVDEARFAITKTLHGMVHDVEVGRYLEWLSRNYAKAEGQTIPGVVVEASERYRDTFAPSEWVKVPDMVIPGTSTKKYGALAGHYLPGPIWNDLRQVVGGQFRPFGDTYAAILRMWKTSKTALSPGVHMNNVMSNFVMADWQDVHAAHVGKALRIVLAGSNKAGGITDREAAAEILNRYKDSGGDIGSWATQEIARDQLDPLLADLDLEMAATNGQAMDAQAGIYAALQHALGARFPAAWEALKAGKSGRVVGKAGRVVGKAGGALIDLYQAEDDVFRLAAWLKAKEEGADDLTAGKRARRSFLDYNINAPWIQAMRNSAWPFISFTYRAAPMLAEIAGKKPHKLFKLMVLAGGLNAIGVMLGGGGDDDERKMLPEEKAGSIWGMVPKLIRMPWNDDHGSPVYLDIRRWVPVGDVFDMGQGNAAIPMLPGLMPGGPLVLAGEVVLNKSAFTGKAITLETDTATEKAEKLGGYLYKAFAPNIVGLPGTYATEGVVGSMTGRTDAFGRELSTAQALATSVGVKLGSYPADVLRRNLGAEAMAQISEIDKQVGQLKRQYATGRMNIEEFREQAAAQNAKKAELVGKLREKLQ
jgi:hypothetical protein